MPTPTTLLDLLRRRVRYLDGKVAAVQAGFNELTRAEAAMTSSHGARGANYFYFIGRTAGWVESIALPIVGLAIGSATARTTEAIASLGPWADFDRQWAQRIAPKIRDMRSALVQLNGLSPDVTAGRFATDETGEVRVLWDRGRMLCSEAARLIKIWQAGPPSAYDTINSSITERAIRSMITGVPGAPTILRMIGTTPGSVAAKTASGGSTAGSDNDGRRWWGDFAETMQPSGQAAQQSQSETNWSAIAVTTLLVAAGGYMGYRVVKDVVLKRSS